MSAGVTSRWSGRTTASYPSPTNLIDVNQKNILRLREFLEVEDSNYSDSHYERVAASAGYSQMALCAGRPIGCICCSLNDDAADAASTPFSPLQKIWRQSRGRLDAAPKKIVKILLLVVSPNERSRGVGSTLLRYVIRLARLDSQVSRIVLDVHAENEGAIRLYRRFGFRITTSKKNYSKSWVMELPNGDDPTQAAPPERDANSMAFSTPQPKKTTTMTTRKATTPPTEMTTTTTTTTPLVQLRRKDAAAGVRFDPLTNASHRWTIYSISNWRRA